MNPDGPFFNPPHARGERENLPEAPRLREAFPDAVATFGMGDFSVLYYGALTADRYVRTKAIDYIDYIRKNYRLLTLECLLQADRYADPVLDCWSFDNTLRGAIADAGGTPTSKRRGLDRLPVDSLPIHPTTLDNAEHAKAFNDILGRLKPRLWDRTLRYKKSTIVVGVPRQYSLASPIDKEWTALFGGRENDHLLCSLIREGTLSKADFGSFKAAASAYQKWVERRADPFEADSELMELLLLPMYAPKRKAAALRGELKTLLHFTHNLQMPQYWSSYTDEDLIGAGPVDAGETSEEEGREESSHENGDRAHIVDPWQQERLEIAALTGFTIRARTTLEKLKEAGNF